MKIKLLAIPGLFACGFIWLLPIENKHYGFTNPGVNPDMVIIAMILSLLTIIYAMLVFMLNYKVKYELLIIFIIILLAISKLVHIIIVLLSYY